MLYSVPGHIIVCNHSIQLGSMNSPVYSQLIDRYPVYKQLTHHKQNNKYNTLHAAHRGARYQQYTENTIQSYNYAVLQCGCDILEIDLCYTKDNIIVLTHDHTFTLPDNPDNTYNIQYLTYNQLNKLHNRQHYTISKQLVNESDMNESFVTLEQLLIHVTTVYDTERSDQLITLYLDYKMIGAIEPSIQLLQQYNMLHRVIMGAVDHQVNQQIKLCIPKNIPLCADIESMQQLTQHWLTNHTLHTYQFTHDIVGYFVEADTASGTNQSSIVTYEFVNELHKHSKPIFCVGELCDDKNKQIELIELGVDCLFVDQPRLLSDTLQSMNQHE